MIGPFPIAILFWTLGISWAVLMVMWAISLRREAHRIVFDRPGHVVCMTCGPERLCSEVAR